ncbi:hypothetical protein M427DRAFT_105417 [Gonapodya prolifera JEL478]|uniref:Band 7 domain-containing protein n=1 Tax=Gonapodya prolifera (strain JEL478) TaxID=1344416 RepID=A0A138ZY39_GONPJ|nr:hypothetical protein M427DRAFT_105417 [Gonapodya prolifera JEL478]|eukprot:KXS09418.1 hypothetical protein M427DRAFT_105417 [Gonapodya prolifera JEL478]
MSAADRTLQSSYAHQIPIPYSDNPIYEGMTNALGGDFREFSSLSCPPRCCELSFIVVQGSVGLIQRFGKYYRAVDPGLYYINPFTESLTAIDIKVQVEDIPRQVVMTKDNVTVTIDSVLYWKVVDPYAAAFLVANVRGALVERTQTTLRQVIGARTLQECVENREVLAHQIQDIIEVPAKEMGADVTAMLLKDLQFSAELQDSLSAAAKQQRIGESKIIAAKAEVQAAKLMREAADILNHPAAMQIRYLETLAGMAKSGNTKGSWWNNGCQPFTRLTKSSECFVNSHLHAPRNSQCDRVQGN